MLVTGSLLAASGVAAALALKQYRLRLGRCPLRDLLRAGAPLPAGRPVHLLLCVADHFEPAWGNPTPDVARQRVANWEEKVPRLFDGFRDRDGRPPRHTFFFPPEQYRPEYLDALARLSDAGFGEVEIHVHHDRDTAAGLRHTLQAFKDVLAKRHGLLARRRDTGEVAYGFVHGNWALCNGRPDGRWCGVNDEIAVLRATGCYADFTMPSAPDPTQTRKINSLYYACDAPDRPRGHDTGADVGTAPADGLMLIQGPLLLDWERRKGGLLPRLENGCIQRGQVPTMRRLGSWLRARVQVPSRPDWFFVKLHTHGAPESNQAVLLGDAMVRFHAELAERAASDPNFIFHYVTGREMYNLARAAEAGWTGSVAAARDFELVRNGDLGGEPSSRAAACGSAFACP